MVDVELNCLYQVNTTHLLMEECSHTVEEGSHTVEECSHTVEEGSHTVEEGSHTVEEGSHTLEEGNGSGSVQWNNAMEMKHQSS